MVFVTGDCHAEYGKFSVQRFPEQKELTRDDIVIVCGDFGIWHDDKTERYNLNWLAEKPFTIVFVDGNHENFDRLYSDEFPIVEFHGGKAHKIRENVYHLMRGYIFDFNGKKFFAFGGASSHDISDGILDRKDFDSDEAFRYAIKCWNQQWKMFRVNHLSWWAQEQPSEEELAFGLQNLIQNGNKVDFIISHCCPQEISSMLGFGDHDRLTMWFNTVAHTVEFSKWYFGHYHIEQQIMGKFVVLYDRIERIA